MPNANLGVVAVWTTSSPFPVDEDLIARYARATNDADARHRAGIRAPTMFAVVPAFASLSDRALAPFAHHGLAYVHGEHVVQEHRPIYPGDIVTTRSAVVGIHRIRAGAAVVTRTVSATIAGECLNQQWSSTVFHGATVSTAGEQFPASPSDAATIEWSRTIEVAEDQAVRYAAASGDHNPIHLNDEAARAAGLPGVILHGLCTLALAAGAMCPAGHRMTRISGRFVEPVRPGESLTVQASGPLVDSNPMTRSMTCHRDDVLVLSRGRISSHREESA